MKAGSESETNITSYLKIIAHVVVIRICSIQLFSPWTSSIIYDD